jgi:TRAP-type uncharacterized transport system substrate-binding protein
MMGPTRAWVLPSLRLGLFVLTLAVILVGVWKARPPRVMTIETGPVGGSYYENALHYRQILAARGIELRIVPNQDTRNILEDVGNPGAGIDVGFVAQDVGADRDSAVSTIGLVQLQPLFIFASAELGRHSVLDDLRGRRIVMPPSNSVTADAAMRVFELYDITPENSSFTFLPLADAVRDLRAGRYDVGVFMLAPENKAVRELAGDSGLHLVPISEAHAIANHLPFLRSVVLPRGIYDIPDAIPPSDTPMLAARVGVVARKGLHPWLVYSLLEAIAQTHSGATLISDAGDYPTIIGAPLEVNPLAARWYQTGTPWIWRELPPALASFVDSDTLVVLGVLLFSGIVVSAAFLAEIVGLMLAAIAWVRRRRGAA